MSWIWYTLGIIAIISIIASFYIGKNAIWGGFTIGIIICFIVGLLNLFSGDQFFSLWLFAKIITITILIGALFEIISKKTSKIPTEKEASIIMETLANAKVDFEMIQAENIPPTSPYYKKAKRKFERANLKFQRLLKNRE